MVITQKQKDNIKRMKYSDNYSFENEKTGVRLTVFLKTFKGEDEFDIMISNRDGPCTLHTPNAYDVIKFIECL